MESQHLEQRLARLEQQVQRYRLFTLCGGFLVVAALVMGAAQLGGDVQDAVRAKNFYVVNEKGKDIAVLGNSQGGTAGLWFFDKNKSYVVVEQESGGTNAIIHAKYFDVEADGKHLASLGTSKTGTPGLWFYDGDTEFVVIKKAEGPNAFVEAAQFEIRDSGTLLGALGTSKAKNPGLWLRDKLGKEYTIIGSNGTQIWLKEVEFGKAKDVLSK